MQRKATLPTSSCETDEVVRNQSVTDLILEGKRGPN